MAIQHIVAFKYQPSTSPSVLSSVSERFLALQTKCVRPSTGEKYIVKLVGGKQNSPEGKDQGMNHVYLVEFENEDDRKFYLDEDTAHAEFKSFVGEHLADAIVLDFTEGTF